MLKIAGYAFLAMLLGGSAALAQETVQGMLSAQVRTQGFACDNALKATKDTRRSKPDREVWVLKCSNATYRVSRAPDLVAKIEVIK